MARRFGFSALDGVLALLAAAAIAFALWRLDAATRPLVVERVTVGHVPASVYRPANEAAGPAVVIAHGFAGSRQLMQAFAVTLARNGYVAIAFDYAGHGRNPRPLAGSIVEEDGATRTLVAETRAVADAARALGDGRLALLGHSMASDIVVRAARALNEDAGAPVVAATIAVSMFSPAVTADEPENLLVVVGGLEAGLREEALRVLALAADGARVAEGTTVGDPAAGTGRRVVFAEGVEHVGVLYARETLAETVAWLDATFGIARTEPIFVDRRGPLILLLLAGIVVSARPLSRLLPRVAPAPIGAGLPWRRLWIALLVPAIATPLVLRLVPTQVLPVLVADYLAAHFLLYGLIAAACLVVIRRRDRSAARAIPVDRRRLALALAATIAFFFVAIVWPLDTFVTSFVPGRERIWLVALMLVGTLPFFLADEWATRGPGAARLGYPAAKLAFVLSLALAVALDFERLFFLVIIVPVIAAFLLVYGLFSRFLYGATGHPLVAGVANAVAFAWALGVTFPLLAS
ncbi:alpha/beta hydrolase [Salinarimonas ramus]|uniref:Alpha/beta hydrolase n=1 Tax=Salinarimonas ramus TaxID=690164 RepID=A0A917Q5L5_9HYPH|nr:alpha/beta fold hydrolase [Salinarimonas ramus]GGK26513.1 alpha/beta hydrolase [Salinarimonas ramus]